MTDEFIAGESRYKVLTQNGTTGTVTLISGTDYYDECDDCEIVVIIPDSVEYEGILYNVTEIGESAFAYYGGLAGIVIPDSVVSIGKNAFYCCEDLKSVKIGKGVTAIGEKVFGRCKSLTSIRIPDNVSYIGTYAFIRCISLKSVTIPDSITTIGDGAFIGCENLESVTIGKRVTSIEYNAFGGCINLTSILVSLSNLTYSSVDGVLFNKEQTRLIQYPHGKELDTYIIPDGVISIGNDAFNNCGCLASVIIPDSVTSIEDWGFSGCLGLISISVSPSNPKYSSIDGVLFNKDQTRLIQYPPEKKLDTYIIPNNVTSIGNSAFCSCISLENVTIPDGVTFIGEDAFSNCENLKSVYYKGDVPSAKDIYKETPVSLISYYPMGNSSWENKIKGGKWQNRRAVAWDPDSEE